MLLTEGVLGAVPGGGAGRAS